MFLSKSSFISHSLVRGSRARTMSHKDAGTMLRHQCHFLKFLDSVNLTNNVVLLGFSTLTCNVIMACDVATLASDQTICCKNIRVDIITYRLSAAISLSIPFLAMTPMINIYGKRSQLIEDIKHEARR